MITSNEIGGRMNHGKTTTPKRVELMIYFDVGEKKEREVSNNC